MIKFYTNFNELTPKNRTRVFPMLFDWFYVPNPKLKEYFEWVENIEEADVCVLPIDLGYYFIHNKKNELNDFVLKAQEANKIVWVYSAGDFGTTLKDDVITFRLGGFHSKMNASTYVMPSFINNPYQTILKDDIWKPLEKKDKPTIGFVGNADGSLLKWSKELVIHLNRIYKKLIKKDFTDKQSFFPSSTIRFRMLKKLQKSLLVNSNFIYRNKYRAGATTELQKQLTTQEFYKNIEKNLYTFCLRGSGNFSVRFYETLIMGRIPLLIDTDVRLPFHDQIDWTNRVVWVNTNNYERELVDFHARHTNEQLKEIQIKNRELALSQLNRVEYFCKIAMYHSKDKI